MAGFGNTEGQSFATEVEGTRNVNLRAGTISSGVAGTPISVQPEKNPLVEGLLGVAGNYLQKETKRQRTENYIKGRKQVISGKSVEEMREEDTLFNKLFMENSAMIEGAIEEETENLVASEYSEHFANLDKMAETMTPEEFAEFTTNREMKMMTGDASRDQALMEKWQPLSDSLTSSFTKKHMAANVKKRTQATLNQVWNYSEGMKELSTPDGTAKPGMESAFGEMQTRRNNALRKLHSIDSGALSTKISRDLSEGDSSSYNFWKEQYEKGDLLVSSSELDAIKSSKTGLDKALSKRQSNQRKERLDSQTEIFKSNFNKNYSKLITDIKDEHLQTDGKETEFVTADGIFKEEAVVGVLADKWLENTGKAMSRGQMSEVRKNIREANNRAIDTDVEAVVGRSMSKIFRDAENGLLTEADAGDYIARLKSSSRTRSFVTDTKVKSLYDAIAEGRDKAIDISSKVSSTVSGRYNYYTPKEKEMALSLISKNMGDESPAMFKFLANTDPNTKEKAKIRGTYTTRLNKDGVSEDFIKENHKLYKLYKASGDNMKTVTRYFEKTDEKYLARSIIKSIEENGGELPAEKIRTLVTNFAELEKRNASPTSTANAIVSNALSEEGGLMSTIVNNDLEDDFPEITGEEDIQLNSLAEEVKMNVASYLIENPAVVENAGSNADAVAIALEDIAERRGKSGIEGFEKTAFDRANVKVNEDAMTKEGRYVPIVDIGKVGGYRQVFETFLGDSSEDYAIKMMGGDQVQFYHKGFNRSTLVPLRRVLEVAASDMEAAPQEGQADLGNAYNGGVIETAP